MFRYSLRTLIGLVAAVAIACAALMNANAWIASSAWTVVTLLLGLATIAALVTRRSFAIGFAVMGWLYFVLVMGPFADRLNGILLTSKLLDKAPVVSKANAPAVWTGPVPVSSLQLTQSPQSTIDFALATPQTVWSTTVIGAASSNNDELARAFVQVGQALWTMLFGLVGGMFGAFIVVRNNRQVALSAQTGPSGSAGPASPAA